MTLREIVDELNKIPDSGFDRTRVKSLIFRAYIRGREIEHRRLLLIASWDDLQKDDEQ